jgi:glycine/D-amino acid oxidase-like deaminating enzyme
MFFSNTPTPAALSALAEAKRSVYWLDRAERPAATAELVGSERADLVVIGGGFTGLWAALLAKQADPERIVLLVEGGRIAEGASGRNGGFVSASLTHGFGNGMERWPDEMASLLRLGHENLDAIEATIGEFAIGCDFVRAGELDVAVEPHQLTGVEETAQAANQFGQGLVVLGSQETRARVNSPSYLGGVFDARGTALVDPARLAWGLRQACIDSGVVVRERTPVTDLAQSGSHMMVSTRRGMIRAGKVVLATNAYPPLLKRLQHYVVPVYDYVLMTEPLSDRQWSAIGWSGREGVSDAGNQFHYYRTTDDGRILWGGYDAVYHRGNGFGPQFEHSQESYERLATHFLQTFPDLEGIRFSHAWGGAIDTCSRFSAFWGTANDGMTAYVAGYTGLGVGASRFGAATMLDLLDGKETERTALEMVRTKPLPFPPEPMRSWAIGLTTASIRQADENAGKRNIWLRTLDQLGLGFDS